MARIPVEEMTPAQRERHEFVERMKAESRKPPPDSPLASALARELVSSSKMMDRDQIRWLVKRYDDLQVMRIAAYARERDADEKGEPHAVNTWLAETFHRMEKQLFRMLRPYAEAHEAGRWMLSQTGIGPVVAAGFLAYFDIEKAPTVGHFWSFAGLLPGQRPIRGQQSNYNDNLKSLCWIAANSFVYQANKEEAYYGNCYKWRKDYEWKRNLSGDLASEVARALKERQFDKSTSAYKWLNGHYSGADFKGTYITGIPAEDGNGKPMLPPAHIAARAKRYAVKLFIAHLHQVMYEVHYNRKPPLPYMIEHHGHTDFYPPNAWESKLRALMPDATPPWRK